MCTITPFGVPRTGSAFALQADVEEKLLPQTLTTVSSSLSERT